MSNWDDVKAMEDGAYIPPKASPVTQEQIDRAREKLGFKKRESRTVSPAPIMTAVEADKILDNIHENPELLEDK